MQSDAILELPISGPRMRSFVPGVAVAAGLTTRYRYWRGGSGKPYLFTRIDRRSLADFSDAVVLLADGGRIIWVGEAVALRDAPGGDAGTTCYVHLLTRNRDGRLSIARDLGAGTSVARGTPSNVTSLRSAA